MRIQFSFTHQVTSRLSLRRAVKGVGEVGGLTLGLSARFSRERRWLSHACAPDKVRTIFVWGQNNVVVIMTSRCRVPYSSGQHVFYTNLWHFCVNTTHDTITILFQIPGGGDQVLPLVSPLAYAAHVHQGLLGEGCIPLLLLTGALKSALLQRYCNYCKCGQMMQVATYYS